MWGLPGVLLGSVVSLLLVVVIWKPYYLYRSGFKLPYRFYIAGYLKHFALVALPGVALHFLLPSAMFLPTESFGNWVWYGVVIVSLYSVATFMLMYALCPAMRTLIGRFPIKKLFRGRRF